MNANTDPGAPPTFLTLFACLKRMVPLIHYPRLRFILPQEPDDPNAHIDFFYYKEDDTIYLHYRERHHGSIYLGSIDSYGSFAPKPFPKQSATHIDNLLTKLAMDFADTVKTYGQHTGLCALCGLPLIDPTSLTRGTTPNCAPHLLPEADLDDIN